MPSFTAADVKRLRELTGAGMLDCKNALTEADGDVDGDVAFRQVGFADLADPRALPVIGALDPEGVAGQHRLAADALTRARTLLTDR